MTYPQNFLEESIYRSVMWLYHFGILISSLWMEKSKKWIAGRKDLLLKIEEDQKQDQRKSIWFHCASLGEFEQGRPLLESLKKTKPQFKIILSFFSPSGYEVQKKYDKADYIYYLPQESEHNAQQFIDLVNPQLAIFVKYDLWYFYIKNLFNKNISIVLISAIFRPTQIYFMGYGNFFLKILKAITLIFVQNETSLDLLKSQQLSQVLLGGDTRFDRVQQIKDAIVGGKSTLPKIDSNLPICVLGSIWEADLKVLLPWMNKMKNFMLFIIAPHEIHEASLKTFRSNFHGETIRYTAIKDNKVPKDTHLIVDTVGQLSHFYGLAEFAYVGGGFGAGIHNILEPAIFGIPVFFGPNYHKSMEAKEMIALKSAFTIKSEKDFSNQFNIIWKNKLELAQIKNQTANYVAKRQGSTMQILQHLDNYLVQK